ncbi:MAG: hypothetical protein MH204_01040 [Fimbriimonadaceae bacterium]|nr:hypothetical protein [Fimbriimonadaceae bacterium]
MTPAAETEPQARRIHPLFKAFLFWHMACALLWSAPQPPPALVNGQVPFSLGSLVQHPLDWLLAGAAGLRNSSWSPVRHYMSFTGLWQAWDMFAPNPASIETWFRAEVTTVGGKTYEADYPRMAEMNLIDRFMKERYRKYTERVRGEEHAGRHPSLARFLVRRAGLTPGDPPSRIVLYEVTRRLPDFGSGGEAQVIERPILEADIDPRQAAEDLGWPTP